MEDFFHSSHEVTLESVWFRFGRWADMAPTISQPWVWERTGLDVLGITKLVPYGPAPLRLSDENQRGEMDRSNMAARSNKLFFFINWFHVARTTISNPSKIAQEITMDFGELFRGPLVMGALLWEKEPALAFRTLIAYLTELYECLNRNRKLATLHTQGTAYLYPMMNIIAVPLFLFNFHNFYTNSVKAGWAEMMSTEPFTPRFYSLFFYNVGKTLSPLFVLTQFYVPFLRKNTAKILAPLARHLQGTFLDNARTYLISMALKISPVAASHHFLQRQGPSIYNFGMYLTGAIGTVIAVTTVTEKVLYDAFESKILSWGGTLTSLALYTLMYSRKVDNLLLTKTISLKKGFILLQEAIVVSLLLYDYLLYPALSYLAEEKGEL